MDTKRFRRYLLLFFIILLIGFFLKNNWQWAYSVEASWRKPLDLDIEKLAVLDKGVSVTWNGDSLFFYDKNGKVINEVDRTGEGQVAYFGENVAFLYDFDLKKVAVFDSKGKEIASYVVEGEVFSVEQQNGNILIFTKQDRGEILYLGDKAGGLAVLFQTDHFIVDYYVKNTNEFTVSELSNEASGYKTTLYWKEGDLKKEEFPNQVSMEIGYFNKSILMATEKSLFLVTSKEVKEVEIPLLSDIYFDDSGIYLLHSGILSKYNKNLEKVEQRVMTANVTNLDGMNGSIMAQGNGEIIGNLMGSREFRVSLEKNLKLWDLKDGVLLTYVDHQLSCYTLNRKIFGVGEDPITPKFEEDKKE